jgi:site-specific DNA recombinase
MQAVIYARVSLLRNGGRSVEDQERECRSECDRRGWDVRAVFCDRGISASRYGKQRPEWEKCKKALRADDILVTWECSRNQRDLEEFVHLRNMCADIGVLLSYSGRVLDLSKGDDRFTGGLDALLAERESEQLRERVLRGKRAGLLAGRPAGRCPWGYRIKEVDGVQVPGVWEPHPVEAPKIKEAVARILRGESHYSVWQWLCTQDGYKPPTLTVMNRSLRNPTIAGFRIHRGAVEGKGNWEPLITEVQHRQLTVQHNRLKSTYHYTHNPGPEPRHLLSGIAKCDTCKEGVSWRKNRHGTPIYACINGHVTRQAALVDKLVEDRLFEILAATNPRQYEDDDPEVARIWAEVEALETKRAEWQELALKGSITPQSFARFEQDLDKQIAALEDQAVPDEVEQMDLTGLPANWGVTPMVERRRIVRAFFTITIKPSTQGSKIGIGGVDLTPLKKRSD